MIMFFEIAFSFRFIPKIERKGIGYFRFAWLCFSWGYICGPFNTTVNV